MSQENAIDGLRRDGYVLVRGLLPESLIGGLLDEFRAVFRRQMRRHGIDGADAEGAAFDAALADLFRADMGSYLAAAKLTQYLPSLHRLGSDGPILELVRALGIASPTIATRPVVHIISDDLKVPGGYHRTPSHQDWRSVQGSLDALVVWLPLVPIEVGFNALEIIPGSHRRGLLATVPHPFGTEVVSDLIDDADYVPVEVRPGDALAFSMFLVHRTGGADRPGVRWAVSLRYNNMDEPSFVAHDYPNPFVYKSQEALLFEGFPTAADVARIYAEENG
jgi:ectoine hydroxylase-related dioxygenase (phytanoyl-CoA dioxygenase family)